MSGTKMYSLLLGGLSRASDMPRLEQRVVPSPSDVEAAARTVLGEPVTVTGGQRDPSIRLGLVDDDQDWPTARRYVVEVPSDVLPSRLYAGLVHAMLDVAPLPPGITSEWTVRIAL